MKLRVDDGEAYCFTGGRAIEPAKGSVVFIHGAGLDHTVWTPAARHFARHGRNVIAVDLPGHGRSGGDPLPGVETMADWVAALLDALAVERAALCGHSLGSLVALDCAARYPDRARALAMVGTTVPMPVSDVILDAARADDHAAFDLLTEWGYSRRHQYGGSPIPGIWMPGSTLRLFERARPGVLYCDMNACDRYTAGLERAAAVRCPTLLVLGEDDRLTPPRSTLPLQQALHSPALVTLQDCGHTIMAEAPNALLDALHRVL